MMDEVGEALTVEGKRLPGGVMVEGELAPVAGLLAGLLVVAGLLRRKQRQS